MWGQSIPETSFDKPSGCFRSRQPDVIPRDIGQLPEKLTYLLHNDADYSRNNNRRNNDYQGDFVGLLEYFVELRKHKHTPLPSYRRYRSVLR
jgi:hypothetical protein